MAVDHRFAYLTDEQGRNFQVLQHDADGDPVDWDEAATHVAFDAAQAGV